MTRITALMTPIAMLCLVFSGMLHAQDGIDNWLDNGGYEDGISAPWSTYGAATTEIVDKIKGADVDEDIPEGKYALLIVVNEKGANFWDTGLQHAGHVFEAGAVYTLSAWLKAAEDTMQINFKPELGEDPWTGYGAKAFTFTDTWAEYHTTTPAMPNKVQPATITFHIGYEPGEFWVDGVRFYEGEYVPSEGIVSQAVQPEGRLTTLWAKVKSQ